MKKPKKFSTETVVLVDTTERDRTRLALIHGSKVIVIDKPLRAQSLQEQLEKLLKKDHQTFADIDAFAVLTKPGSLTGVRIGVVAVNTIAWLQDIPVIEVNSASFEQALRQPFSSLKKRKLARVRY